MPLTEKGKKIMKSMKKQYGKKKGETVFYASKMPVGGQNAMLPEKKRNSKAY